MCSSDLKAIEVGGESATMLDHLGDIEYNLNNQKESIKLWEKALILDPKNESIKKKIKTGKI